MVSKARAALHSGANVSRMKKPWAVAIINAILPGVGYLVLGKRRVFGLLIFLSGILLFSLVFDPGTPALSEGQFFFAQTLIGKWASFMAYLVLPSLAFGYDAYALAKEA